MMDHLLDLPNYCAILEQKMIVYLDEAERVAKEKVKSVRKKIGSLFSTYPETLES